MEWKRLQTGQNNLTGELIAEKLVRKEPDKIPWWEKTPQV